jgi:hypothetical protein
MATYATDLVVLASGSDAESGTWTELGAPYDNGSTPASDGENYIQGSASFSQQMGTKITVGKSICFDAGSDISSSFASAKFILSTTLCTNIHIKPYGFGRS